MPRADDRRVFPERVGTHRRDQAIGVTRRADGDVDALGGEPGVHSARYAGVQGDDAANNARLLDVYPLLLKRVMPFFLGKDARDLDLLLEKVFIYGFNFRYNGISLGIPLATIEFAILDMLGRIAAKPMGALVDSVEKGEPAEKAGIEAGDIIVKVDGRDVRTLRLASLRRQFGIVLVPGGAHHFEVATFRKDEGYLDGRRPVAVLFTDIRQFTNFSESHSPQEVVDMLNIYFSIVNGAVREAGGHPGDPRPVVGGMLLEREPEVRQDLLRDRTDLLLDIVSVVDRAADRRQPAGARGRARAHPRRVRRQGGRAPLRRDPADRARQDRGPRPALHPWRVGFLRRAQRHPVRRARGGRPVGARGASPSSVPAWPIVRAPATGTTSNLSRYVAISRVSSRPAPSGVA